MALDQFQIRRLVPADAADYRSIRLAALEGDASAFGSTYQAEAGRPLTDFAERLATSAVHAAYSDGGIVGMAGFKRQEGVRRSHKAFVWGMYVCPQMRRRGVARALMAAVLEEARGLVEQLTLSVVQDNAAAIALYRELGFEVYGVEPRALKSAGVYAHEVLMVRLLATPARSTA